MSREPSQQKRREPKEKEEKRDLASRLMSPRQLPLLQRLDILLEEASMMEDERNLTPCAENILPETLREPKPSLLERLTSKRELSATEENRSYKDISLKSQTKGKELKKDTTRLRGQKESYLSKSWAEGMNKEEVAETLSSVKRTGLELLRKVEMLEGQVNEQESESGRKTYHGSPAPNTLRAVSPRVWSKHEPCSGSTERTSTLSQSQPREPQTDQLVSQRASGRIYSVEGPSTLTPSTPVSTLLNLCQRALEGWDRSRSEQRVSRHPNESKRQRSGSPPGMRLPKRPRLRSPTEALNSETMGEPFGSCSTLLQPCSTIGSSSMIRLSEEASEGGRHCLSPTTSHSSTSILRTSCPLEPKSNLEGEKDSDEKEGNRYVEASMGRGAPIEIADSNIPVESVETPGMDEMSVLRESQGMITRPRFLRFNCWNIEGKSLPRVVTWTLSAEPLPKTPILSPSHPISILLKQHPNLFPIVTPINVKAFCSYLERHPNRAFCESVCEGLEKGFWPWAKVDVEGYSLTHDEVREPEKEFEKREFIRRQRDLEISKGRFTRSFGKKLLPGMYSMPTFAVPKEGSAKFRLVTDQSAGKFPVNGMQTPHEHAFPMDNMTQLGDRILRAHNQLQSGEHLVLFKSDVAEAYRLIPMSPVWQTRQINTVDGERFVDHNNVFGGKRSGDTFIAFMSLVLWAAETVWHIPGLCNYIDDVFTAVSSRQWRKYEPYNTVYPEFQTCLLECWDAIGIPHKKEKQLFGSSLTIIGIHVNAKNLTLSLAPERRADLLEELDRFIVRKKKGEQQKRFTLQSFLQLAGWLSWSFNVYPYLRPCLCNIYHKIGGLKRKDALVYTNRAISRELEWAERHIQNADYGTMFLEELQWPLDSADYTIFCDASGTGLGFWYPELNVGYTAYSPPNIPRNIYFGEGLCIAAALDDVRKRRSNCRVVVYTDNEASFRIFSSFHAVPQYNPILLFSAGLMMKYKLRVRVVWMPGKKNRVADALSRHNRDRAVSFAPGLLIHDFTPPYDAWAASALPWAVLQ
ncbi:hypothetical protein AGABI1DRAFT_129791 [Agaricus bisporus var. burnettii JB137-S8]|uniref:Reverse transcriptase domain-containing protein n=1 Tax=Agaricus bisporus var. burnettii (strain JB137-S8 / ATCC MYA-4627 / FGSC 10392) TaxID=597362 RepID=K5VU65_AGABU|nr:uncharacterized protein AGABI1DRAFT_129791 [Agaricus bisporus var. burnettii JB137-S8]EKM78009.1 hypothetical protein AGABI1DRAFT_129791 [Agaricus bisporus var. burnettii JB137-S8]